MSNPNLSAAQQDFVEGFAHLLINWGISLAAARLYAYLLLVEEPVSLDDFASRLSISKSGASTAARELETLGIAQRHTERGSKRIRYVVTSDPSIALHPQTLLLGRMADFITTHAQSPATPHAQSRLQELARFHRDLQINMQNTIKQHRKAIEL